MRAPESMRRIVRPPLRRFRRATASRRMLPGFIIIGAQRAGTTSLFYYLRCHPDIEGPKSADASIDWPKEVHYFDEHYSKGSDWYRSFFPLEATRRRAQTRGRDLVAGEGTPYYMFHPLVPERVAATVPDVRLIAILRDPIERAYSHYQLMRRTGREKLSFEEAIAAEPERLDGVQEKLTEEPLERASGHRKHHHHRHRAYVGRSMYAEQLERWLALFPREQLLALRMEDFAERPAEVYTESLDFLGARHWLPKNFKPRNIGGYAPIDPNLRAQLAERFADSNARLAAMLGWERTWDRAATHDSPLHSRR